MIKYALRDLIAVGNLYKTIGVKGEIIIELNSGFDEKFAGIQYLFIAKQGQSVPYFVHKIKNQGNQTLVKFEDIDSPEEANAITNNTIYLENSKLKELGIQLEQDANDLIGYDLFNEEQKVGKILAILEYPGQTVLEIDQLNNVIPFVEDWILDINIDEKWVKMTLDQELLNLND